MHMLRRFAALLAVAAAVGLVGCASAGRSPAGRAELSEAQVAADEAQGPAGGAPRAPAAAKAAPAPAPAPASAALGAPSPAGARPQEIASRPEPAAQPQSQVVPASQRLRVYSGNLELVVPAPQETAQKIIALTQEQPPSRRSLRDGAGWARCAREPWRART